MLILDIFEQQFPRGASTQGSTQARASVKRGSSTPRLGWLVGDRIIGTPLDLIFV